MSLRNSRPPDPFPPSTSEPDCRERVDGVDPRPSFDHIYHTTFRPVWRLLRRVGIPKRHQPDVAQEAFLRIARRLNTYDPTVDLHAWVLQIANHAATVHRRLARNRREQLADADETDTDDESDLVGYQRFPEGEDRAQHVGNVACYHLVARLLQAIPNDRDRAVVLLHDLEERTLADIARVLNIPWSTANGHLARGRKAFVAAMKVLEPIEREALGSRGRRVIAFFPIDRVRYAEAERHLDESEDLARLQEEIWSRLQQRLRGREPGGREADRGMRRVLGVVGPTSLQVLGLSLVLLLADGAVDTGLVPHLAVPIQDGETPGRISPSAILLAPEHVAPAPVASVASTASREAESPRDAASQRATTATPPPSHAPYAAPRASREGGQGGGENKEDLLLDRARAHLAQAKPDAALALVALRLHATKYPQSSLAPDRERLLSSALALAGSPSPAAATATRNPTPRKGR